MTAPDWVNGQLLGLAFPASIERLRTEGSAFLTAAFRATGAIDAHNRVTEITRFEEFIGGGAGRKLSLSVTYAHPEPHLHTELFVKYPRDFGDPLRELFSHLMEPETRFALLSRRRDFPVAVPKCYFADYDPVTRSGILITERIAFDRPPIERFYDKCLDYEMPAPLEHYQALITTLGKLAGAHKSGSLGGEIDQRFPHAADVVRADDRIPYDAAQLSAKIEALRSFVLHHPGLLPEGISSAAFLDKLAVEALRFHENEVLVKRFLNARPEHIALCHWNANVDNAWFWRKATGELEAGLFDWGSVGRMSVAQSIFGALCAVETDFWNAHRDELIALFIEQYAHHGGPRLDFEELRLHVQLFVALLGLAWMIDAPAIIDSQLTPGTSIRSRYDPAIRTNFLVRAQLQLLTVFLNAWAVEDYGAVLERLLVSGRLPR